MTLLVKNLSKCGINSYKEVNKIKRFKSLTANKRTLKRLGLSQVSKKFGLDVNLKDGYALVRVD